MAAFLSTEQSEGGTSSTSAAVQLDAIRRTSLQGRQVCGDPPARGPGLAPREREVLIAWLLTDNKELVGRQLHISPTTVRTHLQRIRAKYAAVGRPAPTKAALVARAIQDGLISVDDL